MVVVMVGMGVAAVVVSDLAMVVVVPQEVMRQ
jgi:hypothetical protein